MSDTPYLYEHENPNADTRSNGKQFHGYPQRRSGIKPRIIVVHTAEITPDDDGEDTTAERLASYASRTDRTVSWHKTSDADSIITMLPDEATAFHVRGYNTISLGLEICTRAHLWGENPDHDARLIEKAREVVHGWADEHDIPLVKLSRDEVDAGESGVVGHVSLDPKRRSDPGNDFPWGQLLSDDAPTAHRPDPDPVDETNETVDETNEPDSGGGFTVDLHVDTIKIGARGDVVKTYQGLLLSKGVGPRGLVKNGLPDGQFGRLTHQRTREFQAARNITVDGIAGPETWGELTA